MKEIEVITGCMFAGKTTELINRLKNAKENYILIKPIIDNRDHGDFITTHDGLKNKAIRVNRLSEIYPLINNINLIGIDEAQFFSQDIISDLKILSSKGLRIIISGLEKDYLDNPFGSMSTIIKISSSITRLTAKCHQCNKNAIHSYRKDDNNTEQLAIGSNNLYEALCTVCLNKKKLL
jgi:thymidine kinase